MSETGDTEPAVLSRREGPVRWVTLNRPGRLNAMNGALVRDLTRAFEAIAAEPEVRVIILHGAGRAFCSGDDLKDIDEQARSEAAIQAWIDAIQRVTLQIMNSDKIVIAAVHGWCVGGAMEWAVNCDFRLFAEDARWFFPEVSYGLFVTGGVTALLTKQLGPQKAKELMILGDRQDAQAALDLGIAWKLVPEASLLDEAQRLADRIAARPQASVTSLKRAVNAGFHSPLEVAMAIETEATVRGFLSPEARARARDF